MTETEPTPPPGRVVLVGAGPGGPGLLTVAAIDALRCADIVFYDRLAGPAFRRFVRPTTELVDVGKRPGRLDVDQATIQDRLIAAARAGHEVVRVKGGSPFVFGRGYEEVMACRAAGLDVAVIPGLSSAIAAPTSAGIPLTHRGLAPAFVVVSGHEDPAKGPATIDWRALAALDVPLVILMGVGTFGAIAAELRAGGRTESTPVAAIESATLPSQRVVHATLADAPEVFAAAHVTSPAVLVVGEVAAFGAGLDAGSDAVGTGARLLAAEVLSGGSVARGLSGWRVVVPRSRTGESTLALLLGAEGATVDEVHLAEVAGPPDHDLAAATIAALRAGEIGLVAIGSRLRLDALWRMFDAAGDDLRLLAGCRIWATTGDAVAGLAARGLRPDLGPGDDPGTPPGSGASAAQHAVVVALTGAESDMTLTTRLAAAGWDTTCVEVGALVPVRGTGADDARRRADAADAVVFASSGTARAWADAGLATPPVVACVGESTAAAARSAGIRVDVVPAEPTLPALVAAVVAYAAARSDGS